MLNPAQLDNDDPNVSTELGETKPEWTYFLRRDLRSMLNETGVVLLIADWWNSRGSILEASVASTLGIPLYQLKSDDTIVRAESDLPITTQAQNIVLGDRRYQYGHPAENFQRIADRWTLTLQDKLSSPIDAQDVALAMIDIKIARQQHESKRDNLIDICGYAMALDEAFKQSGELK